MYEICYFNQPSHKFISIGNSIEHGSSKWVLFFFYEIEFYERKDDFYFKKILHIVCVLKKQKIFPNFNVVLEKI